MSKESANYKTQGSIVIKRASSNEKKAHVYAHSKMAKNIASVGKLLNDSALISPEKTVGKFIGKIEG